MSAKKSKRNKKSKASTQARQLAKKIKRRKELTSKSKGRAATKQKVAAAKQAWNRDDHELAMQLYEEAIQLEPDNAILHINTAWCFGLRFKYRRAYELLNRARELEPQNPRTLDRAAELYLALKDLPAAEECCEGVLSTNPTLQQKLNALTRLAWISERSHKIDRATEWNQTILKLCPDHPRGNLLAADLLSRDGRGDAAIDAAKKLANRNDVSSRIRADAMYLVANLLDRSGDFDGAFAALRQAKEIYRSEVVMHKRRAEMIDANNRRMLSEISADHFARWHKQAADCEPLKFQPAWLIGHPRSGTTLLEQVLDSHMDVTSADELVLFSECIYPELGRAVAPGKSMVEMLDLADRHRIDAARKDYGDRVGSTFPGGVTSKILIDKNPELTLLLPAICKIFPESKVIVAIRDPRDVVLSCFFQALPLNSVSYHYLSIESTARKYAAMIGGWLKMRPMMQSDWIEIRYEETVENLPDVASRSISFLGLDWDEKVLDFHHRAKKKHIHSPTYQSVTRPIYSSSVGRWRNYAHHMQPAIEILDPFIRQLGYPVD